MKKKIILVCVLSLVLAFTGCSSSGNKGTTSNGSAQTKAEIASCEDLLNQVWDTFAEDEKFAAVGGGITTLVDGKAGNCDLTDTEYMMYSLMVPEDQLENVDEAASLIHMMNANTFTGAAFHLKEMDDVDDFVEELEENIKNTQWICGFPDLLNVFVVNDEYVVSVFGNAEIMENFKAKMLEVYGDNVIAAVEESLV